MICSTGGIRHVKYSVYWMLLQMFIFIKFVLLKAYKLHFYYFFYNPKKTNKINQHIKTAEAWHAARVSMYCEKHCDWRAGRSLIQVWYVLANKLDHLTMVSQTNLQNHFPLNKYDYAEIMPPKITWWSRRIRFSNKFFT